MFHQSNTPRAPFAARRHRRFRDHARKASRVSICMTPGADPDTLKCMIKGIEHTAIASPDPARLAQWYVDHLHFTINYQSPNAVFVKAQNGYMLEIIRAEGERASHGMKDPGLRHLAIAVDDFDSVYGELRAKGVRFLAEPLESKGNKVVFFSDPEGNILHLLRRERPLD
jgi:glyoxylase I family protein